MNVQSHMCQSIKLRVKGLRFWVGMLTLPFTNVLVSEWLLFNTNSAILWREQVNLQWGDDEECFVLDQHA